ncbi:MAG TPA: excinuclease ABC subunit UvrC [Clostridia bacterium]|nr:excinuclease ABC subunit UvrC [Clostridia bacterium]
MFAIKDELKKMPDKSGVYIMRNEKDEIIYVGKAVNLKNRVRQYFHAPANHAPKVRAMVSKIARFEYIITDTELEALILECNLIKKHKPKYNILLKDDKTYPYIKVTINDEYPRLIMTRRVHKDGAKYYGPYSSVTDIKETIELLKKIFPLKTCNKVLPRDIGKGRPCLNYYIYRCIGPCVGNVDKEKYILMIKDVCSFLDGKEKTISNKLGMQMKDASARMNFEEAAVLRDRIAIIKNITDKQKVFSTTLKDQDVIAFAREGTDCCVQVFFIRGGKLIGREHFLLDGTEDVDGKEIMSTFVKQFYNTASFIPKEIILQNEFEEMKIIQSWLSNKKASSVKIISPKRGEQLKLVEMVMKNATMALEQFKERIVREDSFKNLVFLDMSKVMGFNKIPERIESYDISNTGLTEVTGSMVVAINGQIFPKEYRRFKIKNVDIQNDYGCMQEMVQRRFTHSIRNDAKHNDDSIETKKTVKTVTQDLQGFDAKPNLILVDGGIGHVNAIKSVLASLDINISVWGMVKDARHRTRGVISPDGEETELKDYPALLRFITEVQDETHRFALQYNKRLRKKRYETSALDGIDGIGPSKKKLLLKHFGSVNTIKKAGIDDLSSVYGISEGLAQNIFRYFHRDWV